MSLATFLPGVDRIGVILGAGLLYYLGVSVGSLLLVVPGIVAACGWSLVFALLADEKPGVNEALTKSWRMTQGHRFNIFLFWLVALAIPAGVSFASNSLPAHVWARFPRYSPDLAMAAVGGLFSAVTLTALPQAYRHMSAPR